MIPRIPTLHHSRTPESSPHDRQTLDGRQGTFVIQHWGLADGADQSSEGSIVPNPGTGELVGIAGRAMESDFQELTLAYTL
ncbi:DUF3224 domain-containing protein [Streptomyces griseochromogenes]|uniref:DUF3224 domain-containing protein n=1 Tax=Streptomyces griseochromogenes TaxID=68214 RepID=UPI001AD81FB4